MISAKRAKKRAERNKRKVCKKKIKESNKMIKLCAKEGSMSYSTWISSFGPEYQEYIMLYYADRGYGCEINKENTILRITWEK